MTTALAKKPGLQKSVPSFFNPANAGVWNYRPSIANIFNEAQDHRSSYRGAHSDKRKVHLLLIDVQRDFCFPEGTLYVAGRSGKGAIDDSRRMAEFIYRNLGVISNISCTLDTHRPFQIFSRSFWQKADGTPVDAFTTITAADIDKGVYRPSILAASAIQVNYNRLLPQCRYYCEQLEKAGKYQLYIWPEHCILGSEGHVLVGLVEEAVAFHAYTRGMQTHLEVKGAHPLTENYSVLGPEVSTWYDGSSAIGQKNVRFIQTLLEADYVVIAGQAASHCVKSSIDDLLSEILQKDPALARKVYVMEDCMSAVTVPDGKGGFFADFTPQAEDALKRYASAGMHVVKSTDPIDTWPDLVL